MRDMVTRGANALHHRFSAILAWPWNAGRVIHYIIHRRVRYRVTVEDVPRHLICARCGQVPSIPKKTGCSKTVCRKCVGYHNQCPFCANSGCIALRNLEYVQQISKLKAKCPTSQCKWHGKVEEVTEHLQQCSDVTVICKQCGTKVPRKLEYKHKNCCPLQKTNCFYCKKEGLAKDITVHEEKECPLRKVKCPYMCGDLDIFHDQLKNHLQKLCPLRPVLCTRCNKVYVAEELEQHYCVPPPRVSPFIRYRESNQLMPTDQSEAVGPQETTHLTNQSPSVDYTEAESNSPQANELPSPPTATNHSPSVDYTEAESNSPQPNELPSPQPNELPLPQNATVPPANLQTAVPIAEYTTYDNTKSKTEVLQRFVVSYIILCLLSTMAYLRNQRATDVQFEHDMEIPSVLLWSIFTSSLVFLVILGGSSCYKNLFMAINAKECIVVALVVCFIHLIRFYPSYCVPIILGSLCGSAFEVFLFQKYIKTFPGQFTNTVWVMTLFVGIVLAPFIIVYYSSISNLRAAIMQLVYIIYIVVLREKRWIEIRWQAMTQENRTMGIFLINGIVLFSITLYSVTAISYELFSTSCSSLKIMLAAVLPVAYFYILAMEHVQDKMLEFGEKLYKSSIYSFWGRVCMVSIFYYTITICLIIPLVQETGDLTVGSALASVLIVYSIIVQTGLFLEDGVKQILKEPSKTSDNDARWHEIPIQLIDIHLKCSVLLKVRFVQTIDIENNNTGSNATTLTIFAELERNNCDMLMKETMEDYLMHTLSLSVINKQWRSSNETIEFSSQDAFGPVLKSKLGSACLELPNWQRYLNCDKTTITLDIQLNHQTWH